MRLYVIRHALAEPPGVSGDAPRRLTGPGRRQAKSAGRILRLRGVLLARLWASPAARAWETAELIAGEIDPTPPVERLEALYGSPTVEGLLAQVSLPGDVGLVGHLPFVEHLVRGLLSHPAELRFPPSTVCCLEFESALSPGAGRLAWVVHP